MRLLGGTVVLVTALLLAGCGGEDDAAQPSGSGSATPSASVQDEPKETPDPEPSKPATPTEQLEAELDDADMLGEVSQVSVDGRKAVARFEMADNLSSDMIQGGARTDTLKIIGAAQKVEPKLRRLAVVGTFELQNKYGKSLGQVPVMRATYTKVDLGNIEPDNIVLKDSVWELASGGHFLHPAMG